MTNDRPPIFRERLWVPWWAYVVVFAAFTSFVGCIGLFLDMTGDVQPAMRSPFAQFALCAGVGLSADLVIWVSHHFRTITVDETTLAISGMSRLSSEEVPLERVATVAIVRGREVGRLRKDMSLTLDPDGPFAALAGTSPTRSTEYARSMLASPWMRKAVVVFAPGALTELWLIGSPHAEELAAAIRRGAGLDEAES
jgi:hypothetical protein